MNIYLKRIHDQNNHCISITKNIFEHFELNPNKDKVIYDGVINKYNIKPINKKRCLYFVCWQIRRRKRNKRAFICIQ